MILCQSFSSLCEEPLRGKHFTLYRTSTFSFLFYLIQLSFVARIDKAAKRFNFFRKEYVNYFFEVDDR